MTDCPHCTEVTDLYMCPYCERIIVPEISFKNCYGTITITKDMFKNKRKDEETKNKVQQEDSDDLLRNNE